VCIDQSFCHDVKVKLFADDLKLYAAVDSDLDFEILQSSLYCYLHDGLMNGNSSFLYPNVNIYVLAIDH
jgi:hypothetical protein